MGTRKAANNRIIVKNTKELDAKKNFMIFVVLKIWETSFQGGKTPPFSECQKATVNAHQFRMLKLSELPNILMNELVNCELSQHP